MPMAPPPPPVVPPSQGLASSNGASSRPSENTPTRQAYSYADVPSGPRNSQGSDGGRQPPTRPSGRPSRFDTSVQQPSSTSGSTPHDDRDAMDIDQPPSSRPSSSRPEDASRRPNMYPNRPSASANGVPLGTPRMPKAMTNKTADGPPLDPVVSPSAPYAEARTPTTPVGDMRSDRPLPPHMSQRSDVRPRREVDSLPPRPAGAVPDGPRRGDDRDRVPENPGRRALEPRVSDTAV